MTVPASGYLPVEGGRLWYEATGDGPPLVLVHSGITDRRMWNEQVQAFAGDFRVARYDLRGFGESSSPEGPFQHLADLRAVLDHFGVESAHIIGSSFGAAVAVDFAVSYPDRVRSLVLAGPALGGARFESPEVRGAWDAMGEAYEAGDIEATIEIEVRLWVDGLTRSPGAAPAEVRERVREMQRVIYAREPEDDYEVDLDPPAIELLDRIAAPVLVIVGEHDVPDIQRNARTLVERAPNARAVEMAETAHLPSMERPEEFNRLVQQFLSDAASPG